MSRPQATGKRWRIKSCQFLPLDVSRLTPDASRLALLLLCLVMAFTPAAAQQFGLITGWAIQITGMVQVEPGPNVVTFGIKKDEIRFLINDIYSRDRNFSSGQFFAEIRNRTPNVFVKGSDELLELLIKERPSKRVLKLVGVYYLDSHTLLLHDITPVRETPKEQF
jgi:hypothetical protein